MSDELECVVIGSGHAGIACTMGLLARGVRPTVVDVGYDGVGDRLAVFDEIAAREPQDWSNEEAEAARAYFPINLGGYPLKPVYGSFFPYAIDDSDLAVSLVGAETVQSLARGGLSNTWGSSVLPYRAEDLADWPIGLADLEAHYRSVLEFMPITGEHDDLERSFPILSERCLPTRRTAQVQALAGHLSSHHRALAAAGVTYGAARLAVVADPAADATCRYCGLCMHGCPYGSIYNTSFTLSRLVRERRVDYRAGIYVDRVAEDAEGVEIVFHARGDAAQTGRLRARRVFLACGTVSTTRLVLASLTRERSARMLDSQTFLAPMLARRSVPVSTETQGLTLAQLFLEIDDQTVASHGVHLQVYGYSDIMLKAVLGRLKVNRRGAERLLQPVIGRLFALQGFLHSDDSPGLRLELTDDGVRLVGDVVEHPDANVRRLMAKLRSLRRAIGAAPVPGFTRVGPPAKSFHFGGSLPMRDHPVGLQSDVLGRPCGAQRIHVVDSSVFPSIASTTIAFTAMANAHRIAIEVAPLD